MRRMKMPFVKAKVGPRIMTLIADPKVYEILPVKKEVKAVVSGIYITEIKSVRGGAIPAPPKKKGFFARFKKDKSAKNTTAEKTESKGTNKKPCIALIHGFLFYYLLISFAVGESEAKFHYH